MSAWSGGYSTVNSINSLNALSLHFKNPWLLFVIIPAAAIMLIPYFRLPKQHRRTRNRVISLVLHSVMLLCLTLVLAGLSFTYTQVNIKNKVILLVDVSDSVKESEDEMGDFIKSVISEVDDGYSVGVVTFADGCVYNAKLNKAGNINTDDIFNREEPARHATDISSALLYAKDLLPSHRSGRIILLSDGQQTDGNAIATVQSLAEAGIRVDTVYFPSKGYAREVQITSVEASLKDEVSVEALVTVESSLSQPAVLTLYDNGNMILEQSVTLSGGQDVFSLEQRLSLASLHEIRVTVGAALDTLTQNNTYYTFLNLEISTKTLLVDGGARDTELLSGILDESFDITKITVSELPDTVDKLSVYNEVILMNVANADLPAGFDDILTEYVKVRGGGLYTIGGDRAYIQDDMSGTKYEELLPVLANTDAKTLGLLLVIDSSGSMNENKVGAYTRLELAIDAAKASVECLNPDDYVGVISFNTNATDVLGEMMSLDRKNDIIRRINDIKSAKGTDYGNALNKAKELLLTFNKTELKHVIFLTDGEPSYDNYLNLVDDLARNDITLSSIALGATAPTEKAEEMAERGGGRFYGVSNERELKRIMVEETTVAAGHYYNEVVFTPSIVSHTSAVAGITTLPKLGGFYGSRIKEGATMVLGYEGSPIYAEWSCGLGRVGSFMCDLYGDWSAEFLADENGIRFINNTVGSLISKAASGGGGDLSVEFNDENFTTRAVIKTNLSDGEELFAQLISPDGQITSVNLDKLTGTAFAGIFRKDTAGIYTLRITKTGNGEISEYTVYTAFSYSKEYSAFADRDACFDFLEEISANGNGSMLFSASNLFTKESQSTSRNFNPALILLVVSAALFLLNIVARKFKLKLPGEIREERRGNPS